MRVRSDAPRHLTYCLNIHPGESLASIVAAIRDCSLAVKSEVARHRPFGLGLRLGAQAARELENDEARRRFKTFLADHDLYVFTVNAFPYGAFHGSRVKENVYAPDWRTPERLEYTQMVAAILADLLPAQETCGSVSTVPGSFKPWIASPPSNDAIVDNLARCVAYLVHLEQRTGKTIHLGLEPEPGCYLERVDEVTAFFENRLRPRARRLLAGYLEGDEEEAEARLRDHLGVCMDTCHVAVQFEELAGALERLQAAGVRLSKIQLSAAVDVPVKTENLEALSDFDEPVYLHQVRAQKRDGNIAGWNDLPEALPALRKANDYERARVHFHVPLFWTGSGGLGSTADALTPGFWNAARDSGCEHFEIETYTFGVLPEQIRPERLPASIAREFAWVLERL